MSELKPSIKQMIEVGKDCGLHTVEEAFNNYMNHYTMFFLIEKYNEQYRVFLRDCAIAGLIEEYAENELRIVSKSLYDI